MSYTQYNADSLAELSVNPRPIDTAERINGERVAVLRGAMMIIEQAANVMGILRPEAVQITSAKAPAEITPVYFEADHNPEVVKPVSAKRDQAAVTDDQQLTQPEQDQQKLEAEALQRAHAVYDDIEAGIVKPFIPDDAPIIDLPFSRVDATTDTQEFAVAE